MNTEKSNLHSTSAILQQSSSNPPAVAAHVAKAAAGPGNTGRNRSQTIRRSSIQPALLKNERAIFAGVVRAGRHIDVVAGDRDVVHLAVGIVAPERYGIGVKVRVVDARTAVTPGGLTIVWEDDSVGISANDKKACSRRGSGSIPVSDSF